MTDRGRSEGISYIYPSHASVEHRDSKPALSSIFTRVTQRYAGPSIVVLGSGALDVSSNLSN